MPHYSVSQAKEKAIGFCKSAIPKNRTEIVNYLRKEIEGFYPKSHPSHIIKYVERDVLLPLEEDGFLVSYIPGEAAWKKAGELVRHESKRRGVGGRGKINKLYQTNFLYWGRPGQLPTIYRLPKPKKEMNLDLAVFLHRFHKPPNYTWEMINLLMSASVKKQRDDLRIHLYVLPFDYNEVELLERVLEFGEDFKNLNFPFRANIDEAKGFLATMAVGK